MSLKLQHWSVLFCLSLLALVCSADESRGVQDSVGEGFESVDPVVMDFAGELESVAVAGKDIVLVLDNSVSMKKSDPQFLVRSAATEFIGMLGEGSRIAVIVFDQDVSLALPLANAFENSKENILASLEKLNYQGLFTDSPSAIERALYELRNSSRESAQKVIIFVTDGSVDTGDMETDTQRTRWLISEFVAEKVDEKLHFFGIALGRAADQSLLQSLSLNTKGESYIVQEANELQGIFAHIHSVLAEFRDQQPALESEPAELETKETVLEQPVADAPLPIAAPPIEQTAIGKQERIRSIIILAAAVILIFALLAIVFLLIRRNNSMRAAAGYEVEAYLNDIHGHTSQSSYKLDAKPTMLGRVAGKDSEHLNFIVIPQSTIGRRHALIDYKDFGYWISDQGSINGTFVNDRHIKSEVRLKHGDRVRLHKHEFEFVMPETGDAGATVVSTTEFSEKDSAIAEADAVLKEVEQEMSQAAADLHFDLTGSAEPEQPQEQTPDSDDETLVPSTEDIEDIVSAGEDETLLPGGGEEFHEQSIETDREDETLMPGSFDMPADEAESESTEEAHIDSSGYENFFDLTGDGDEDKKP